jgi:hypothetical protein
VKINITDDALKQLDILNVKNIKIIFHGQGCGGPVLSIENGQADSGDVVLKVQEINFSLKLEWVDRFETIDIDYSVSTDDGFSVESDNCGGCIRCNGCWLNTIKSNIISN